MEDIRNNTNTVQYYTGSPVQNPGYYPGNGHGAYRSQVYNQYWGNSNGQGYRANNQYAYNYRAPYQQYAQPMYINVVQEPGESVSGLAVASMVIGILSLFFWGIPVFGIIFSALAIIFSFGGLGKRGNGMAVAGLVLGLITIIGALYMTSVVLG